MRSRSADALWAPKEVPVKHQHRVTRKRRTKSEWIEEVRRWRQSGKTSVAYAEEHGLHAGTLAAWGSKVRDVVPSVPSGTRRSSSFLPVRVRASKVRDATESEIEIVLTNGRRVRVGSAVPSDALARLLDVVEGGSPC